MRAMVETKIPTVVAKNRSIIAPPMNKATDPAIGILSRSRTTSESDRSTATVIMSAFAQMFDMAISNRGERHHEEVVYGTMLAFANDGAGENDRLHDAFGSRPSVPARPCACRGPITARATSLSTPRNIAWR